MRIVSGCLKEKLAGTQGHTTVHSSGGNYGSFFQLTNIMASKLQYSFLIIPRQKIAWVVFLLCTTVSILGLSFKPTVSTTEPKLKLSDYQFFSGKMADLVPAATLLEYEVNAPLFSDYAEKKRMIFLPPGTKMNWQSETAFEFPPGAVISKNFFYWNDAAHPEKGRRILETRLLLKGETGWKSLVYVWNTDQTDAFLEVAGATIPISWTAASGKQMNLDYVIPNLNQCKGCHSYDGQFVPVGITARQLNRVENGENQLLRWRDAGHLNLPENFHQDNTPTLFDYRNIKNIETESVENISNAARAYLDGNCAHCHNPHGPASTSGMYLEATQMDMARLGVGKPPVAAGRGSGNRKYGIVPGKPGESILVFRMENDDPGIRMPELGRQLAHREGLEIIKTWIRKM
jgi:uncharacterized repeat protein (TIGR03806 family)